MEELVLEANTANIGPLTAWVDGLLEEAGCSLKAQAQIDVAVDEIVSNIAFYAYAPGSGNVKTTLEIQEGIVTITFYDSGVAFNPLLRKDPDTSLSAEERQIGGLGILLVKKTMDSVSYHRNDGQNILCITKRLH